MTARDQNEFVGGFVGHDGTITRTTTEGHTVTATIDWKDVRDNPQHYDPTVLLRAVMFGKRAHVQIAIEKAIREIEALPDDKFTLSNGQRIVYEPPNPSAHDALGSLHRSPVYYNPTAYADHLIDGLCVPPEDAVRFKEWLDHAPWRSA